MSRLPTVSRKRFACSPPAEILNERSYWWGTPSSPTSEKSSAAFSPASFGGACTAPCPGRVAAAASPGGKDLASAARSPGACCRSASFSESSSRRDVSSGMTMRSETATAASPCVDAVCATRPNSTTMSPASSDTLNASAAVSSTDSSQRSIG